VRNCHAFRGELWLRCGIERPFDRGIGFAKGGSSPSPGILFEGKKAMNLHDKAQELVEREEQELDEQFRQLHDECDQRFDEELAHIDQLIRKAKEAEREMDKPITG
jgi:hypothetical protein